MKVLADKIKSSDAKTEIIRYAQSIGCRVYYNQKKSCLEVDCYNEITKKLIEKKVKEQSE